MKGNVLGVIFDLDGTLIDSYDAIYISFLHAYQAMNLPPLPYEEVKKVVGYGMRSTFRDLLGEAHVSRALSLFRQKYEEVFRAKTHLLPDARQVLEALFARGIRMAIATNKFGRFSREIFQHFGMEGLFAAILGDDDVSQNKPHPEILYRALEKMGLKKEDVVFIGDSLIDIQTGSNGGIRVFAVPSGVCSREELEEARPAAVLHRLADLLNYV